MLREFFVTAAAVVVVAPLLRSGRMGKINF
jgi:hypothetical protein